MKFNNAEEAKALKASTKEELEIAKQELKQFSKDNNLAAKEDHSSHAKHGKTFKKLSESIAKKRKTIADIDEWMTANKPAKKEKSERKTTYEYPADCTTDSDRKKFRAKMRSQAKSSEKGEAKPEKKEKKAKEETVPAAEEKKSSKSKDTAKTSDKKDDKKKPSKVKED